jgi:hypothetical protein
MTTQTSASANEIINIAAAEVGLVPPVDAFASKDANFIQLQYLLNSTIKELVRMYDWEFLVKEYTLTTVVGEEGVYDLPSDFMRMIDQTGWERSNRNPMNSLTAQQWQYLEGRDLVSESIYVNFRIQQNKFTIYPSPITNVYEIAYEYITKNAVIDSSNGLYTDVVKTGADVVVFDEFLVSRMLKTKWLQAKGFDSSAAQDDVNIMFAQLTGADKSAQILNAGARGSGIPLLNGYNTSDTNYGNT